MTTAQMVTRLRDLVDEDTSAYFDDDDIKQSLDSGQWMVISTLYNKNPEHPSLNPLKQRSYSIGYSTIAEPTNLWKLIGIVLNDKPCKIRTGKWRTKENNTYLAGTADDPYVYQYNNRFDFDPAPTEGEYDVEYYKTPTSLTSGDSDLRKDTHESIVQYALGDLLLKREKFQEAAQAFEKYNIMVSQL